jgi:hypothetical protein
MKQINNEFEFSKLNQLKAEETTFLKWFDWSENWTITQLCELLIELEVLASNKTRLYNTRLWIFIFSNSCLKKYKGTGK